MTRANPMMTGKGGHRALRWQRHGQGFVAEEDTYFEDEWDFDEVDEEGYYEEFDEYTEPDYVEEPYSYEEPIFYEMDEAEGAAEADPQLEEAYAAYLDARRQFANLKAARGYTIQLWP